MLTWVTGRSYHLPLLLSLISLFQVVLQVLRAGYHLYKVFQGERRGYKLLLQVVMETPDKTSTHKFQLSSRKH